MVAQKPEELNLQTYHIKTSKFLMKNIIKYLAITSLIFANFSHAMDEPIELADEKRFLNEFIGKNLKEKYFTHFINVSQFKLPREINNAIFIQLLASHEHEFRAMVDEVKIKLFSYRSFTFEGLAQEVYDFFYEHHIPNCPFFNLEIIVYFFVQPVRNIVCDSFGTGGIDLVDGYRNEGIHSIKDVEKIRFLRVAEIIFRQNPNISGFTYDTYCWILLKNFITDAQALSAEKRFKTEAQEILADNDILFPRNKYGTPYSFIALDFFKKNQEYEKSGPLKFNQYFLQHLPESYEDTVAFFHPHKDEYLREYMKDRDFDDINANFRKYCEEHSILLISNSQDVTIALKPKKDKKKRNYKKCILQ